MKKSFRLIITIICIISFSSVYGQWTTSGTNVTLTDPTNNVVIGPTQTQTQTQTLYLNDASTGSTTLNIDNNASTSASQTAALRFSLNGTTKYWIYQSKFSFCGSGFFHIAPTSFTALGIHLNETSITFSSGQAINTCAYNFPFGQYRFDGIIGGNGLNIGYNASYGSPVQPTGYQLMNAGASYFNGKVVIGTTSTTVPTSSYKLYVGGTAICEELIVKLQANWADFVFVPNYKLMPLNEVKTYIAENNHLPNVPAACEVEEKGVATGEMLTIQMKKIEELTLYLIQMQEQNEAIQKTNNALLKRIEVLESK